MASVTTEQTKFLQKWNENVSRTVTRDLFLVLSAALTNITECQALHTTNM